MKMGDEDKTKTADLSMEQFFANASLNPDSTDEEGIRSVKPAYEHSPIPPSRSQKANQKELTKKGTSITKDTGNKSDSRKVSCLKKKTNAQVDDIPVKPKISTKRCKSKISSPVQSTKKCNGKVTKKRKVTHNVSKESGNISLSSDAYSSDNKSETSDTQQYEIRKNKRKKNMGQKRMAQEYSSSSEEDVHVSKQKRRKKTPQAIKSLQSKYSKATKSQPNLKMKGKVSQKKEMEIMEHEMDNVRDFNDDTLHAESDYIDEIIESESETETMQKLIPRFSQGIISPDHTKRRKTSAEMEAICAKSNEEIESELFGNQNGKKSKGKRNKSQDQQISTEKGNKDTVVQGKKTSQKKTTKNEESVEKKKCSNQR